MEILIGILLSLMFHIDTDLFQEKEMIEISAPFAPYRSLFMWYMVCACGYLCSRPHRCQGHSLSPERVASGPLCLDASRKRGPCQPVGLFTVLGTYILKTVVIS